MFNLTELLLKFTFLGAEWILYLLILLSFVSVAVMIDRILYFRSRSVDVDLLGEQLIAALRTGDLEQAMGLVRKTRAIECVVIAAGLGQLHRGVHAVSEAMQSAKARERLKLEAHLPILGTLGSNAPFVGLLGTVLGIIKASHDMSQAQAAHQAAASAVMSGVFEALVATAVGLMVAIPAVVAFNIFQRKVRATLGRVDVLAHLLLSVMKPDQAVAAARPTKPAVAPPSPVKVPDGR